MTKEFAIMHAWYLYKAIYPLLMIIVCSRHHLKSIAKVLKSVFFKKNPSAIKISTIGPTYVLGKQKGSEEHTTSIFIYKIWDKMVEILMVGEFSALLL